MKALFIHGLASSGAYKMASTLRILLHCEVIAPDVPIEPGDAMKLLHDICASERPDIIVGLSLGGFMAQKLRGFRKVLVNPNLHPSRLLSTMKGRVKYLSPRADGAEDFLITDEICAGYKLLEDGEFIGLDEAERSITRGCFATDDEMVRCGDEFELHYPGQGVRYPGRHLPDYPATKTYILPVIQSLL